MASHRAVVAVALLAGLAGALTSLLLEPTAMSRLAASPLGQRLLTPLLQASAPTPPAHVSVATPGQPLPAMTLTTPEGTPVRVPQSWGGRTTLVNLWASWCRPCLEEIPHLRAFSARQGPRGVHVVGIALDDADAVRAFLARQPLPYPVLIDPPGPADAGVRLGNPAGVLPFSALISADGRLLKTRIGPFTDPDDIAHWALTP